MKRIIKNENGFTLVELLLVILILGTLMAIAMPKFSGVTKNSDINATESDLRIIKNGLQQHYIDNKDSDMNLYEINKYSEYEFKLISGQGLDVQVYQTVTAKDNWGNPYMLYVNNKTTKSFTILSLGPDAKKSTSATNVGDDIIFIFYPKFE